MSILEHKAVPVNGVEVVDEALGIVAAIVSVTGLNDRVKDNILPGAYTQTLLARTPKGIWHHDWKIPVSRTIKIVELMPGDKRLPKKLPDGRPWPAEAGALHVVTQFNLETQRGREAYSDVVFFGPEQEWSIGYRVPPGKSENRGGIRYIKMLDLFEYSPVLFGAMPAARTITSVKDAQESWLEMKDELFGSCGDGEGTCCLSCGDKVEAETKADHVHDDARWVIDFDGTSPEGVPDLVGSFGTKHAATDWLDVFTKSSPQSEWKADIVELTETKSEDEGPEPGFDEFMAAFMELIEDLEPDDEIEGKALAWTEGKHKRGTNGRFIKKVGGALTAVRQDVSDVRADHARRRDPKTRFDSARSSYKRSRDRAYAAEVKLAKVQRREPSRRVSDFAATLWASRHLSFDERNGGEFGQSLGVDLDATRQAAALDLSRGDKDRARTVSKMLAKLQSITIARPTSGMKPPASLDPEVTNVLNDIMDRPQPAKRVGTDYARPQGSGSGDSTDLPPTPDLPPPTLGDRVPRPMPPGTDDGGAGVSTEAILDAIAKNRLAREATRVRVKDDMEDIETKRYTSGWDEAKHPRDARGKFTDSPGEAAMKQSLQKMQRGVESATEAISRLQMDEGDVDEVSQAYFNSRVTPARVNPDAPRMLQGNPGDEVGELTDVAHSQAVNNAVMGGVRAQLAARGAGPRLGLDREDTYKLQLLVGGIEMGRGMENPEDRLQLATSMMSGKDYVKTYDDLMVSLNEPKRSSRKTDRAKVMAEALQVDMMATFGQGWKDRVEPISGPTFDQSWKREKARRRNAAVVGGVVGGIYAGLIGAMVVAAKADPAEDDTPDPQAAAGVEPDPMAPPPPLIEQSDVLSAISLPEPLESILHTFDLSTLAAPESAPDSEAITASATLDAINLDEAEEGDEEGFEDDEEDPLAGLEPGEPELDAPEDEDEPVEPEDEVEPEEKSWDPLDEFLDSIHPEDAFPAIDEVKSDDDDPDDLDDVEGFADDTIQSLFGNWQDDEPEEKRFDPSSHPRGPDGRFIANGGAGGKLGAGLRSANRGLQYANKLDPTRKKRSMRRFSKSQKPLWRRERLVAKLQKRKPSRQLVKLEAAMYGAAPLAPDERAEYLDKIGVNLNDMRRNISRDFRNNGASPKLQARVDKNVATLIDLWFRSEAGYKGPESKELDAELDVDALMADMHAKAELVALDGLIADWDEEYVFDLMSKMSPDELEELIEGVETKAAFVSEVTGGMVAEPGKGNKGNIKPIMRWFEVGEGAAKIRWGTSGDFMRCVRLAEKHMNPEHAKGFCNKRHVAVTGSAPGQGHKSDDVFDLETKCLLCTGDIVNETCQGCEGDWSQKGFRRFVENMVERSGDGKFAPKAGGGGGGKTSVVSASGAVVPVPKASPPAKKKTTIERRAGKAVVKGGAKLVARNPKSVVAAGAGFALGRKSKGNNKPARGGGGPQGGPQGGPPGGSGTRLSGVQGRGKADSWVDTIDALADMAGDEDSLLNHMIDKGIAKQKNGDFHINMKMPDIGGMKTRMVGTFDARKVKSTMGMLKNTLTPELGQGQRSLPAGAPTPPPGAPLQLSLPFEAMTIDLDRDVIDLDGETVKIGDSKGFARHLDSNYRNERKKARKLSDQELRDFANEPTRDGTNEDDAAYLDELADRQRASAEKAKKAGKTGLGERAAQAAAKPLIKRDEKKKKADADFNDVMSRLDRLKDTSTEKEFDDAMAKVRETSANLTDEDRAKIQGVFAKKKRDAASAEKAKKAGKTGLGERAAQAAAKPLIKRDEKKKKADADFNDVMSRLDRLKDTSTEKEFDDAMAKVRETSANLTDEDRAKIQGVFAKKKRDAASAEKAKKAGKTGLGERAAQGVSKALAPVAEQRRKVKADQVEFDSLLANIKKRNGEARVGNADKKFMAAAKKVEEALGRPPTATRDEDLRIALNERYDALEHLRDIERLVREDLAKKADGVEDLELKDGDIVLTEDDVWMLRAVVSRLKL